MQRRHLPSKIERLLAQLRRDIADELAHADEFGDDRIDAARHVLRCYDTHLGDEYRGTLLEHGGLGLVYEVTKGRPTPGAYGRI